MTGARPAVEHEGEPGRAIRRGYCSPTRLGNAEARLNERGVALAMVRRHKRRGTLVGLVVQGQKWPKSLLTAFPAPRRS
jgi:hypothetical protein